MTIRQSLIWASQKLEKTSQSPVLDAEVLLSFAINRDKTWIYANSRNNLTKKPLKKYRKLIINRSKFWPVAYLTGHKEFFGLDFKITKGVLVPRSETELLIELALERIKKHKFRIGNVIDVGTGSGNIIISLSKAGANKKLKYYAIDSSKQALKIARTNTKTHGVSKKIKFFHGNLLSPIAKNSKLGLRNYLITANLPYLTKKQLNNLTIKHEPKSALHGDDDGLKFFRKLFQQSAKLSIQDSVFLLEHDPSQKTALTKLAKKYLDCKQIKFYKDLSGRFRIMEIIL